MFLLSYFLLSVISFSFAFRPVVLWHGMGDTCCNPLSLGKIITLIEKELPGVYIKSLKIGNSFAEETENGFFMNVNSQIENACHQITNDPLLSGGYNSVGFSQGAQFLRALVQRCPSPQMYNLISIGGQHQGVYGLPYCMYPKHKLCDYLRIILDEGAYWSWVQDEFVQAEYWHDPINEEKYRQGSIFLADINNERLVNSSYRTNLMSLSKFVMVKFEGDNLVLPPESEWFGFFTPGQAVNITKLKDSDLYKKDLLGLKKMDDDGKLHFLSLPGDHLQFTREWFIDEIVNKYLK